MINFMIKLFAFILCVGILIGGAIFTFKKSNFGAMKSDFETVMASPWFPQNGDGK